jgi:hypothetical protein
MKRRRKKILNAQGVVIVGSSLVSALGASQGTASAAELPSGKAACPTEMTLESGPNVPSELVGRRVPVKWCATSEARGHKGELGFQPASYVVCNVGPVGYDDGNAETEFGAESVECNGNEVMSQLWADAYMYWDIGGYWDLIDGPASSPDGTNPDLRNGENTAAALTEYTGSFGPGSLTGNWKEIGNATLYLPAGMLWDKVPSGCTGVGSQIGDCENQVTDWSAYVGDGS